MSETNPFELLANKETTTGEPVTEQAPVAPAVSPVDLDHAVIDLRCPALRKPHDRLAAWIILTDEYGKPTEQNVDDFLLNFGSYLLDGKFHLPKKARNKFDNFFLADPYRFRGGYDFYADLEAFAKHLSAVNPESDIREFIKTWKNHKEEQTNEKCD